MSTRLQLYNNALLICGERFLATLTDSGEPRRLLDHVWDSGGVHACLERGQWKFAMRTVLVDYDVDITPPFGYRRAFTKPSDWCVTSALCQDEFFQVPLLQASDENGFWYCDLDQIYVRYVSDDSAFGGDLSIWPMGFFQYVSTYFASRIIDKLASDKDTIEHISHPRSGTLRLSLDIAKNTDAMADPPKFPPPSSWNTARNRTLAVRDGGSRTSLIG